MKNKIKNEIKFMFTGLKKKQSLESKNWNALKQNTFDQNIAICYKNFF